MELWLLLILGIIGIAAIYSFKVPSGGVMNFSGLFIYIWGVAVLACLLLYVVKGSLSKPIGVANQTTVMEATILPVDCDGATDECPK